MRVPLNLSLKDVQQSIREIHQYLAKRLGPEHLDNADLKGQRYTNAGDAQDPQDLVTLQQMNDALGITTDTTPISSASGSGGGGGEGTPGTCNSTKPDFTAQVAAAKATLIGLGEDLTGPCGGFKITRLAAQNIQALDNTVGLLHKDSGNFCAYAGDSYSVDIICFIDGAQYDCLGDGGGANDPQWNFVLCGDPTLYRSPVA
jgi:hypothetical protein